ncbi:hypothetical protein [Sodalis sp. dw_96]|uniref:hypothetical protein n=1 Tax=Sodalis sp. dw_96 TaxID=2719794 RepID=UPI001BD35D4F|nr:hypothetical protein [Sodalis sp. dw_96]
MRRYSLVEPDLVADPATAELERAVNILLPIRRLRLNRTERLQREQERELQSADARSAKASRALQAQQARYQGLKERFDAENQGRRQCQESLMKTLAKERHESDNVTYIRTQLDQLQQYRQQQQTRVEQAQREAGLRRHQVEKLDYLSGESKVSQ